jgi:hypothetical protein
MHSQVRCGDEPNAMSNAIGYAKFYSRSHDAVIRVYNDAGNLIEIHEHRAISKSREVSFFFAVGACSQ